MTKPEEFSGEDPAPSRFATPRKLAAVGLAAGLIGGGAAGLVMGNSSLSSASPVAVTQSDTPDDTPQDAPADVEADHAQRRTEHLAEVLAPLVENGTISQEQADAVIAAIVDAAPEHPRGAHGRGGAGLEAAAEAIGVEPSELLEALRGGSTIAEVAGEHGVEVQSVIDAMVAEATEKLDAAVAEGRITQEQADERLADLTDRVTERVNNAAPEGGPGPHGHRPGPEGGAPGEGDAAD